MTDAKRTKAAELRERASALRAEATDAEAHYQATLRRLAGNHTPPIPAQDDSRTAQESLQWTSIMIANLEKEEELDRAHVARVVADQAAQNAEDAADAAEGESLLSICSVDGAIAILQARVREERDLVERLNAFRAGHTAALQEIMQAEVALDAKRALRGLPPRTRLAWAGVAPIADQITALQRGPSLPSAANHAARLEHLRVKETKLRAEIEANLRRHEAERKAGEAAARRRAEDAFRAAERQRAAQAGDRLATPEEQELAAAHREREARQEPRW